MNSCRQKRTADLGYTEGRKLDRKYMIAPKTASKRNEIN